MSSANSGINVNGNGYGTITKTYGASQPANSLLVAAFRFANTTNTVSSISHGGTGADTWVQAIRHTAVSHGVEIWYCKNSGSAAGTFTVSPTYSGTDSYKGIDIYGFSGCNTSSQPDDTEFASPTGTVNPATSNFISSTTSDPVLVAVCATNDGSAITWAVPTNYTANSPTPNLDYRDNCAYGLPGSAGTYAGAWTGNSGSTRSWAVIGVLFKGSSAVGGSFQSAWALGSNIITGQGAAYA